MLSLPKPPAELKMSDGNDIGSPLKRGHRHKRSFAVSGDFEFLKKEPPQDVAFHISGDVYSPNSLIATPNTNSELGVNIDMMENTAASNVNSNQFLTSPRFFISEEPSFTGDFKDVPDAIINLDDALRAKPRSFKSHRRTESAPADLQLSFNLERKLKITEEQVTEEEEEEDNTNASTMIMDMQGNKSTDSLLDKEGDLAPPSSSTILLSPLRARCPSPIAPRDSPSKVGYNTLKINKQKERYYNYYNKQIPSNGSGSSTLGHQNSTMSLSSESSSSNRQLSTPNTPVSMTHGHARKTTPRNKPFKFESQLYDVKQNESKPRRSTVSTIESNDSTAEQCYATSIPVVNERAPQFSEDILLGQPGDTVDLSKAYKSDSRCSNHSSHRSVGDPAHNNDSKLAIKPEKTDKLKKKKKHSRLSIISSLFAKPKR